MVMPLNNSMGSSSVYESLKARYSCGYEDYGCRPYNYSYPMPQVARRFEPEPPKISAFKKFLKNLLS